MENNQQSFWQFSDQLRLHTSGLANLSLNDSIWSVNNPYATKRPEDRRNFDTRVGGDAIASDFKPHLNNNNNNNVNPNVNPDFNSFNDGWKVGSGQNNVGINLNGGFNKGVYSKPASNYGNNQYFSNFNVGFKGSKGNFQEEHGVKAGRKNKEVKKESSNSKDSKDKNGENNKNGVDKRFKTLPPSEALPKNETVGGYIFVCNNDTMEENLKRQLFGLPPRYRDSVRQITPGLPLFLYNYSTHQLHGIYQAASFGGSNIDPSAWEDKKNPGESRFSAQVRVQTRKLCEPLDEDAFRPILHHYDGPKFRLELSVPEALSLLDIFEENRA